MINKFFLVGIIVLIILFIYFVHIEKYISVGALTQLSTNSVDVVYENDPALRKQENFVAPYIPSFYYPYRTYPVYRTYSPYYMSFWPYRYYRPLRHPYPYITAV